MDINQGIIPHQPGSFPTKSSPLNRMADFVSMLMHLRFDQQDFNVRQDASGITVALSQDRSQTGFPWGDYWTFGIKVNGTGIIRVYNGKLRRWGDKVYTAANTDVTFKGTGPQYLVWRFKLSTMTLEIQPNPQDDRPPESDDTYLYGVIGQLNYNGKFFTLYDWEQCGIINAVIFSKA